MLALYVSQYVYRSENKPVYEVPPERYAVEDIVRILLNADSKGNPHHL